MPICKNDPKKSYKGTEPIKKLFEFFIALVEMTSLF